MRSARGTSRAYASRLTGPGWTSTPPNNTIIPNHARIALQITRSGKTVFSSPNVNTKDGVHVSRLRRGTYTATWTLIDANRDTRTVVTQFIEER